MGVKLFLLGNATSAYQILLIKLNIRIKVAREAFHCSCFHPFLQAAPTKIGPKINFFAEVAGSHFYNFTQGTAKL